MPCNFASSATGTPASCSSSVYPAAASARVAGAETPLGKAGRLLWSSIENTSGTGGPRYSSAGIPEPAQHHRQFAGVHDGQPLGAAGQRDVQVGQSTFGLGDDPAGVGDDRRCRTPDPSPRGPSAPRHAGAVPCRDARCRLPSMVPEQRRRLGRIDRRGRPPRARPRTASPRPRPRRVGTGTRSRPAFRCCPGVRRRPPLRPPRPAGRRPRTRRCVGVNPGVPHRRRRRQAGSMAASTGSATVMISAGVR